MALPVESPSRWKFGGVGGEKGCLLDASSQARRPLEAQSQ